ncbi:recombinase family protein, partial [Mesorhizobium sp. M0243]|uniref:recombinase family protein n=1 Tax=Mesorhizobium sp. M0243 TaxID=2956925 RepID=UPI00333BFBB0
AGLWLEWWPASYRNGGRCLIGMAAGFTSESALDAARAKARRGELRLSVPIGYIWHRDYGLGLDPDLRVQEAIRLIFSRFRELGSARQVLISLTADNFHFPRPSDGRKTVSFDWVPVRYRSVISILKNPFYAGVYVYGKSEKRTEIVAGLLACGRCGRRLGVVYSGRPPGHPYYRCERINQMLAKPRCMTFGASRIDPAIGKEILRAVTPMAIEAAMEADRAHRDNLEERHRMVELDLQQARYEASLAERRYAACDPDNRLIAAQLEKSWEAALRRVESCEAGLAQARQIDLVTPVPEFAGIATDLEAAWRAPNVDMRCRQQLLRALVTDIIADIDEEQREVILTIHWKGGQHSQLRIRKPKAGEHGQSTPEAALAVMRSMATRWSDTDIAATLNRMGMQTGQGKTWTGRRVGALRTVHKIHGYRSAEKNGEWLTLTEAAKKLGVTAHRVRRLIKEGVLPTEQVVPDAPHQIRAADLEKDQVTQFPRHRGPCRIKMESQKSLFPDV